MTEKKQIDPIHPLPEVILLEATNHCNLRCKMCPQGHQMIPEKGFMDMALFRKAIDEIKGISGYRPRIGMHATGEPLMHKQFPEMVAYANNAGLYTMIHTNGYLLTPDLARRIVDAGLSEITFSFEGEDPDRYPTIRIGSDFKTVDRNIRHFLKINRETRVIIEVLKFRGIDPDLCIAPQFKRRYPGAEFNSYFASNWHGTLDQDDALREDAIRSSEPEVCPSVIKNLIVAWDGKIHPCGMDFDNRLVMGDLNEETIVSHWQGKARKVLLKKMKQNLFSTLALCKDCNSPYTVRTKKRTLQS